MASRRFSIPACGPEVPHCTELTIRRSRFLTRSSRCASPEAAREFVAAIRAGNADATHNCWAYAAGPPGDTARIGSSDDGEPHGTAGRPMLNVLLHCGVGQICVVVSRWFGGIKLGTGGLARAYQDSVLENLASLPLTEEVPRARWRLQVNYDCLAPIRRGLPEYEARIVMEEYNEAASLVLSVPDEQAAPLAEFVANASNGAARLAPDNGNDGQSRGD